MEKLNSNYHEPDPQDSFGEILYVEDFEGLGPPYLKVVNILGEGTYISIGRDEGGFIQGLVMGRQRYVPNGYTNKTVGPGEPEFLDAIKQNIDCREVFVNTSLGVKKIKVIGDIVRP